MFWYTKQDMKVRWGNTLSSSFQIGNGVKQGGILSPVLFNIYMDKLQVSQFLLLCMSVVVVFFCCFFFFFFLFFFFFCIYVLLCISFFFIFLGKGLILLFCIFSCNSCPFLSRLFFFVVYLWCICLVIIVNKLEVWW